MNTSSWMSQLNNDLRLPELCLPGSHDAGMYKTSLFQTLVGQLPVVRSANSLIFTQGMTMNRQLEGGIRYFDIRPQHINPYELVDQIAGAAKAVLPDSLVDLVAEALGVGKHESVFITHHTLPVGDTVRNMLQAANDFIRQHPKEVILLYFSHFEGFSKEAAEKFVRLCTSSIESSRLLAATSPAQLPLSQLRGKILLLVEDQAVYDYAKQQGIAGFFKPGTDIHFYDKYSNTRSYEEMLVNQMCKFGKFGTSSSNDTLFVLNWTLTPTGWNLLPFKSGVEGYAAEINPRLLGYGQARDFLLQTNAFGRIVNIINGDYWENSGESVVTACLEVMANRTKRQQNKVALKSAATGRFVGIQGLSKEDINENDEIGSAVAVHMVSDAKPNESSWLKKHVRDNIYRLQNAATGLYLRAATDGWYNGPLSFIGITNKSNHLVVSPEEGDDDNLLWHFESLGDNVYHIVSYRRKKDGEGEDRLDGNDHTLYLHAPNDGGFQKWKEIVV